MTHTAIPSTYWEEELRDEKPVDFYPTPSDPSHIVVSRFLPIEGKEVIGHVHVIYDKDEIWYISTNRKGKEIFVPTSDFGLVETKFQRYAHLLALQQRIKNQRRLTIKNFNIKNLNTMKTQNKSSEQKPKKENQFRFIEYEKPTGDGHFITVTDSYHNVIGRVHKSYNDQTKKYEYAAFDHAGNLMSKSEKVWEVKNVYINNRVQLLEAAHQRRIESKQQPKEVATEKPQPTKTAERKNEIKNLRVEKTGKGKETAKIVESTERKSSERSVAKSESSNHHASDETNQQQEREEELEELRDTQEDDRGDMDMER